MPNDLTLQAVPRISIRQFTRVLDRAHSPALMEADALYATCLSYKLDPAVALPWAYAVIGMLQLVSLWWLTEADRTADQLAEHLAELIW